MRKLVAPDKIMKFLIMRSANKYEIAQGTKLSYSRVHESIPRLVKYGLIKTKKSGKSRAGLPIVNYSVTLKGLVVALHDQPELWKKIDDIISKPSLIGPRPLVFKKWDKFVKAGARKVVFFRLRYAAFIPLARTYHAYPTNREYGADDIELIDTRVLCMGNELVGEVFSEAEIASFISVLNKDPELKSFVIKHNEKDIESTAWLLENKKAYDSAIRENRPELFLSKLEHRDPLQKWGIDKSKMPKVRVFEREIEPEDEM